MNMADPTDNQWASCFQETAEKIVGVKSEELGRSAQLLKPLKSKLKNNQNLTIIPRLSVEDEDGYNKVFADATFKSYNFRCTARVL